MPPLASMLALTGGFPQRVVSPGTVLLEEGRRAGVLYVLEGGTVEVLKAGVPITTVSQPGSVLGEVSILLDHPHIATVRVTVESRFREIADPMPFLRAHPDAALHVAMLLAQRLSAVTAYLVDLKRQHEDRRDHLARVDEVLASLLHLQVRQKNGAPTVASPAPH